MRSKAYPYLYFRALQPALFASEIAINYCDLMTWFGVMDLGQHWFKVMFCCPSPPVCWHYLNQCWLWTPWIKTLWFSFEKMQLKMLSEKCKSCVNVLMYTQLFYLCHRWSSCPSTVVEYSWASQLMVCTLPQFTKVNFLLRHTEKNPPCIHNWDSSGVNHE